VRDQETDRGGRGSGSGGLSIDGGGGGRNGVFENSLSDEGVSLRNSNKRESVPAVKLREGDHVTHLGNGFSGTTDAENAIRDTGNDF